MAYRSETPRVDISAPPDKLLMWEAFIPWGLGPRKRCTVVARLHFEARQIAARRFKVDPTYPHLRLRRLPGYD